MRFSHTLVIIIMAGLAVMVGFRSSDAPLDRDYPWAAIADSVHKAAFQAFLSEGGQYMAKDNGGDQTFNYWWNAHVLDVLVDAHLRAVDKEEMILTIL